jgi:triacylglycerol esterase/lipase EstA (alpha/beta hydrolase family)
MAATLLFFSIRTTFAQPLPPDSDAARRQGAPAMLMLAAAAATGPRTSPFEPPKANDHSFVTDAAPGLDTGCTYRSAGPLVFNIEITRYAGELNPDGTLKDAAALVAAGLLSPTATLIQPAFDVDSNATPPPPYQPERDRVSFNGQAIGFLTGDDNQWKLNSFEIPIDKVKFPARGAAGSAPTPARNEVRIDIDTANSAQVWCTAIDWSAQSFKAMSPVLLIHGNNSNGGFFDRQGFTGELQRQHLAYDNSINLPTTTVAANGTQLNSMIPGIVKSFGVDGVHVIVHSKGGLDTREYLANYQPSHDADFKVLSYTSLSTPHNGSVGADLLIQRAAALAVTTNIEYSGFPSFTETVANATAMDAGTPNLTTTFTAGFNAANVGRLPGGTIFNTVAADADTNGDAAINRSPDEYAELRAESPTLQALDNETLGHQKTRIAVNAVYQVLRTTAGVTLTYRTERGLFGLGSTRTIATLTQVPNATPLGNDVLVPIPSGQGVGSIQGRVSNTRVFNGAAGRNHSNVANGGVAAVVVPWLISVERSSGDLK